MEQEKLSDNLDFIRYYFDEGTWSWYRHEPVTGTYDALIASNNLGLIKNTELKHALAKFVAELGFKDHEESMDRINN
tara:strand:+ start:3659 stop:3889 length:231 start_codon:yes stop_codon:yes gene_type:complete